ncbi:glycosyltransferase family 4 protein [Sporosarcina sp. P1]|uniref:glycosyltransferase family 4 protein n=1 Tax=Sporosarcina sp. P1 TaxID=2048257 RepID=UPI000C166575|nr:glycosyltransferase family 4 protein [Sporosarcina sp. P1]PIC83078.1 glycosyl transferase [Sporosarcina sp. P1]
MKALFVHDHKFPYKDGINYYSYGFDEEFFNRYLMIFDELGIVGRDVLISTEESKKATIVKSEVQFQNLKSFSELKSSDIRKKINESISNSDYIIIRLPSVLGLYTLRSAKKLKKPYLIEVVGNAWDSLWSQGGTKKMIAPIMSTLCKKAILGAPYVVYVTEKTLQAAYPTNGQSIACSNVTLHSVSNSLNKRLEKIRNTSFEKKLVIGTCSTLNIYKGQQDVIKAISSLKSQGYAIEYQLVGSGNQEYCKAIAKSYGVSDEVKFLGRLNHDEVFSWLDNIDIYIQPSLTEGLPRAVIEAMSRGCPIMGSDAGGIPELIENEFVFEKGNSESICALIKKTTTKAMLEQSIKNHSNSKEYLKSVLYDRRINFFNKFIEESINIK